MLEEFKRFITRGNLVDLAVAFIIGLAFAAVVTAFVNVVLSIVAAIFGSNVTFDQLTFSLNGTPIPGRAAFQNDRLRRGHRSLILRVAPREHWIENRAEDDHAEGKSAALSEGSS